ncbi:hypothetical protein ILUMI_04035 [Ignelater luminosus]|uniref:DUF5641 domain-containing protein n=1 Tax=Ignelater luminosus TaxID=2038154 RepID=A0A8K0D9P7_IGNLU|nr:hypothetical protein ILUMI_04035 [Ignelater luminosus]
MSPKHDVNEIQINRLSQWQLVERVHAHFWKTWSREYLTQLQTRTKWPASSKSPNSLEVGAIILLIEDNLPFLSWKVIRITSINLAQDQDDREPQILQAVSSEEDIQGFPEQGHRSFNGENQHHVADAPLSTAVAMRGCHSSSKTPGQAKLQTDESSACGGKDSQRHQAEAISADVQREGRLPRQEKLNGERHRDEEKKDLDNVKYEVEV